MYILLNTCGFLIFDIITRIFLSTVFHLIDKKKKNRNEMIESYQNC